MKIAVCIKQVPDTREVRIDPQTNNLIRTGVQSIINPCDLEALQQALILKKERGDEVIVVSMGPNQAMQSLQTALDMGADWAILLSDRAFAGADTLATGYTLATAIKKIGASLVLCGAEAIDGCTAQVGPIIAEELGWTHFTNVTGLVPSKDGMILSRELRRRVEKDECTGPFVACMVRCDALAVKLARRVDGCIEIWNTENTAFDLERVGTRGSPTKVVKVNVCGKSCSGFPFADGKQPVRKRIRTIIHGGMQTKEVSLIRGSAAAAATMILQDENLLGRIFD